MRKRRSLPRDVESEEVNDAPASFSRRFPQPFGHRVNLLRNVPLRRLTAFMPIGSRWTLGHKKREFPVGVGLPSTPVWVAGEAQAEPN